MRHFLLLLLLPLAVFADTFTLKTGDKFTRHGHAEMRDCEKGEELPADQRPEGYCGHPYVVPYFHTAGEREPYRVVFQEGKVVEAKAPHRSLEDGEYFFVMDDAGNFYFFTKSGQTIHHSSFFAGGPIAAGGDVKIEGDELRALGYYTGHYLMNKKILENAVDALKADGVDTDSLQDLGGHK